MVHICITIGHIFNQENAFEYVIWEKSAIFFILNVLT